MPRPAVTSRRRALWAMGLYHASNDGALVAVAALFPILLTEGLLRNFSDIGFLTLVGLSVTVVGQILFGAWSDRVSPRILLPAGMVVLGVASLLTTLAVNFAMLLSLVALARVGASFYHPIGISWVGRRFKDNLDHAMGFQSAAGDLGVIAAFASSGFLGLVYGWQTPFIVWGVLALLAALFGYILADDARAPEVSHRASIPWTAILRNVLFWIPPLAIGGAAYIITVNYGHLLMIERLGFREDLADLVVAAWIGAGVVSAYSYGRISRVLGRLRSLILAFLIIGVSGLVLSAAPPAYILLPVFILFGIGVFITYPGLFAFISESTEEGIGGTTFGVIFGFQLVGGALAGYAAGVMADVWGIHTPFLLLMALGFLAVGTLVGLAPFQFRQHGGRAGPETRSP